MGKQEDLRTIGTFLDEAAEYGLEAEVVYTALKSMQEDPTLNPSQAMPEHQFYVSDIPLKFQAIAEQFLGYRLQKLQLARLD